MDNFKVKPKQYRFRKSMIHVTRLRPDLQNFVPKLPWHDFSFEGGYIFSHLDGEMVGSYEKDEETIISSLE